MTRDKVEMQLDVKDFENELAKFPVDSIFLKDQSQNLDYNPPMAMDMTQLGLLRNPYVEGSTRQKFSKCASVWMQI